MNLRDFWKAEADKLRDTSRILEGKDKILSTSPNTGFEEILTVGEDGSIYVEGPKDNPKGNILYVFSKEKGAELTKKWYNSQVELEEDIKNYKIAWIAKNNQIFYDDKDTENFFFKEVKAELKEKFDSHTTTAKRMIVCMRTIQYFLYSQLRLVMRVEKIGSKYNFEPSRLIKVALPSTPARPTLSVVPFDVITKNNNNETIGGTLPKIGAINLVFYPDKTSNYNIHQLRVSLINEIYHIFSIINHNEQVILVDGRYKLLKNEISRQIDRFDVKIRLSLKNDGCIELMFSSSIDYELCRWQDEILSRQLEMRSRLKENTSPAFQRATKIGYQEELNEFNKALIRKKQEKR